MNKLLAQDVLAKAAQNIVGLYVCKEESKGDGMHSPTVVDISDKEKVANTTIRNARNGGLKHISYEKVVLMAKNLLGVDAYDPQKIEDIAGLDPTEERDIFLRRFSHLFSYDPIQEDLIKHLTTPERMKVFLTAYSSSPLSKEDIADQMGKHGLDALEYLLTANLVKEENGTIKGGSDTVLLSIQIAQKMALTGVSEFSHERNKREENWHSYQANNVNKDFLAYWRQRSKEYFEEFNKTSNLPQFSGDIHYYFTQTSDIYLDGRKDQ